MITNLGSSHNTSLCCAVGVRAHDFAGQKEAGARFTETPVMALQPLSQALARRAGCKSFRPKPTVLHAKQRQRLSQAAQQLPDCKAGVAGVCPSCLFLEKLLVLCCLHCASPSDVMTSAPAAHSTLFAVLTKHSPRHGNQRVHTMLSKVYAWHTDKACTHTSETTRLAETCYLTGHLVSSQFARAGRFPGWELHAPVRLPTEGCVPSKPCQLNHLQARA